MMSGHLLKCIRYQAQFSENVIFNQRRKLTNLATLYQNDAFNNELRSMLSPSREEEEQNKKSYKSICNIINQILLPRSVTINHIENIIQHVQSAEDIHTTEALTLLKCCNNIFDCIPSKRLQCVEYLWSHLSLCNVGLGVDHYNERLKLYLKSGCNFSPMDILKEMKSKGICPNATTYDQCIEYYCKKGKIKCTSPLLTELGNQNMSMTENMYNSLIWGYYQNGEIETALGMLDSRIECSVQKNEPYTIHMCINAEENNVHKIKDVLKTCFSHNISFSNKDILTVIYRLTINNHTKHIDKIISYLRNTVPLSSDEIHIILQLVYINRMDIVQKILLYFKDRYISKLFLQNIVCYSKDVHTILDMCNFLDNNNLFENSLYWALYYSYFRDDDLCFPLLKIYKNGHKIKPHFFWPMLVRMSNKYDVAGVVSILKIMINDFNVLPCVYTLCDYVIPYLFGHSSDARKLLVTCGISKIIIDNAFLLMYIKNLKTQNAVYYVRKFPGPYLYNYIAPAVKDALLNSDETRSLVYLSSCLVESEKATERMPCVSIDKLLSDLLADQIATKFRVKKIVIHILKQDIVISPETAERIHQHIGLNIAETIASMRVSKEVKKRI